MGLPLQGLRVLEFAGLAPAPFAGMILADWGADVVRVDRIIETSDDVLSRGKRSIAVSLKDKRGIDLIKKVVKGTPIDVIIEPFRPGVMERLGLGPEVLCSLNPGLIYARMIGFSPDSKYAKRAGHDINYIAASGVLGLIGPKNGPPVAPVNFLGDFAGGGLMCAMGILLAHIEKQKSGKGQVVTADMVNGARYIASFILLQRIAGRPLASEARGENVLDGGCPWYRSYEVKGGKYISVGCIEPQFYKVFIETLLNSTNIPPPDEVRMDQYDRSAWPALERYFTTVLLTKNREEWDLIFGDKDACVVPIIEDCEIKERHPQVAPYLSRTTAKKVQGSKETLTPGTNTVEVLKEWGLEEEEIEGFIKTGFVSEARGKAKL